ncbi:hypothetical protein Dsin_032229 [Dipteronia sinensis]|uniref:RNase H type-1 domain-containing protein n=1 Tax=Dipteronia sinensis TaxID=43782 RepID=A0AAD9ZMN9_9ROSI|nr:hypothetical protein Dsin_032229 [Dipteronia sinensis]
MGGLHCDNRASFVNFFYACFNCLSREEMKLLCVIFWCIWFLRNCKVHGSVGMAVCGSENQVIRDCQGQVMASSIQRIKAMFRPMVAEAMAVLCGVTFGLESGLVPFVFETDALGVVNMINSSSGVASEIGLVTDGIVDHLRGKSWGSVVFVPRKVNSVAHTLSKVALGAEEDLFWPEDYPSCVEHFIKDEFQAMLHRYFILGRELVSNSYPIRIHSQYTRIRI